MSTENSQTYTTLTATRAFAAKFGAMLGMHGQIDATINQLLGERILRENANGGGGVAELDARVDKLKLQLAAVETEVVKLSGKLTLESAVELYTDLTVGLKSSDELYEVFRGITGRIELMRAMGQITSEEEESNAAQLIAKKLAEYQKQVELTAAKVPAATGGRIIL